MILVDLFRCSLFFLHFIAISSTVVVCVKVKFSMDQHGGKISLSKAIVKQQNELRSHAVGEIIEEPPRAGRKEK